MWHDAHAGALALLRPGSLWITSDPDRLWRGDTGALEDAGLGFSPVGRDLSDAHARRSCGGPARRHVYGRACGAHGAAGHLWAGGHDLRRRGPAPHRRRSSISYPHSRTETWDAVSPAGWTPGILLLCRARHSLPGLSHGAQAQAGLFAGAGAGAGLARAILVEAPAWRECGVQWGDLPPRAGAGRGAARDLARDDHGHPSDGAAERLRA